jgi:predicted nuclease with TOPRIM domain
VLYAVLAAFVVVTAGLGLTSYANYVQAEEKKVELADSQATATELRGALAASEADVEDLERRIAELADEKAATEDERNSAILDAVTLEALASELGSIVASLSECTTANEVAMSTAVANWNAAQAGYYVDVGAWNGQLAYRDSVCGAAYGQLDAFVAMLEG